MFEPYLEILPPQQKALWPKLAEVPHRFVLYGGTALALRLGHRISEDFDFFSSDPLLPHGLLRNLSLLNGAKVLQNVSQTLTVSVTVGAPVKLSFFGGINLGRVGLPDRTPDGVLNVASLLDLAGTKAATIYQRAESKDYVDILAISKSGINLSQAMAAARAIYGEQYNPILTVKALTYFGDGDLAKLTNEQKRQLIELATNQCFDLPELKRLSNRLT